MSFAVSHVNWWVLQARVSPINPLQNLLSDLALVFQVVQTLMVGYCSLAEPDMPFTPPPCCSPPCSSPNFCLGSKAADNAAQPSPYLPRRLMCWSDSDMPFRFLPLNHPISNPSSTFVYAVAWSMEALKVTPSLSNMPPAIPSPTSSRAVPLHSAAMCLGARVACPSPAFPAFPTLFL